MTSEEPNRMTEDEARAEKELGGSPATMVANRRMKRCVAIMPIRTGSPLDEKLTEMMRTGQTGSLKIDRVTFPGVAVWHRFMWRPGFALFVCVKPKALYVCELCQNRFAKGDDVAAKAEAKELFGIDDVSGAGVAQVCDPCFQRMERRRFAGAKNRGALA